MNNNIYKNLNIIYNIIKYFVLCLKKKLSFCKIPVYIYIYIYIYIYVCTCIVHVYIISRRFTRTRTRIYDNVNY
jgi:hypothetical protein